MKLGKLPARNDPRVPFLRDRVALIPDVPDSDWTAAVKDWPMLGNDKYGCCAWAMAYHIIQCQEANAWGSSWQPTTDETLAGYATTGFDPVTGANDNGTVLEDLFNHWSSKGLPAQGEPSLVFWVRIAQGDWAAMRAACYWFGNNGCGALLPEQAIGAPAWVTWPGAQPVGGHAFSVAATTDYAKCVTWGGITPATPAFFKASGDETFAAISRTWLDATGRSPPGLSFDQLLEDQARLAV